MNSPNTIDLLNRLVVLHHRSLSSYLSYAPPTWHRGDGGAKAELDRLVADQQEMVDRIGEMIVDNDGVVNYGGFPMEFTGYHDLSFEFLLNKLIEHQRQIIADTEKCVNKLDSAPLAQSLAQESLGMTKAHLESLEELVAS